MSHNNKTINQVEDPIVSSIQKEIETISNVNSEAKIEPVVIKKGTNRLLWNAPTYSAVGVNLNDSSTENPNAYWKKWAEEQEKNKQLY